MKKILLIVISIYFCNYTFAYKVFQGQHVSINQPVYENVYVAGGDVIINAPIYGDLIIAGGTITINDTVTNDIAVAGGNVTFNGIVNGDIRCAGGELHILKNVSGDVVAAGGTVIIEKGAVVNELLIAGGDVTLNGNVLNNAKIMSGKFLLTGVIMKDLDCRGDNITIDGTVNGHTSLATSSKLTIGNNAQFQGDVKYWAPEKIDFKNSIRNGTAIFEKTLKPEYSRWYFLGFAAFWGVLIYLGMALLMILIIEYLFSDTMKKAGDFAFNSTGGALLRGFLLCITVPFAAVIAFFTVIGIPVGILLIFGYVMLLLLATVITSVVAANWLNNRMATNMKFWGLSFLGMGMFIVLKLLTFTPFFGWLIMAILAFIAFGSIMMNIHVHWKKKLA